MYFFGMDVSLTALISIGLILHIIEFILVIKILRKEAKRCKVKPQLKQIADVLTEKKPNPKPVEKPENPKPAQKPVQKSENPKPVQKPANQRPVQKAKPFQKSVNQKPIAQKVQKPVEKPQAVEDAEFEELEGERL